jgi:hypothetical protein
LHPDGLHDWLFVNAMPAARDTGVGADAAFGAALRHLRSNGASDAFASAGYDGDPPIQFCFDCTLR